MCLTQTVLIYGVIPLGLVQLWNFHALKPLNLTVDAALHRKTGLESLFLAIFLATIIFFPRLFLNHTLEFPRFIIIIIIIGTTAHFEPRPSSEASTSLPYSLQHSSSFSLPTSWHPPSRRPPILVLAYPFAFFLLLLQRGLFLQCSVPPV
jgi:hypothetical protein